MGRPVRILVAASEPHSLRATSCLFEQEGYEVWSAATSRRDWELAIENSPDLILLDVAAPDEDSLAHLQRIKAAQALANSPVALLLDHETGSEEQTKSLEAGVDQVIARPISDRELLARVRVMLRIKRMHDELREREKELHCLYGISALAEKPGITLDETLQGVVELMPPAWQYPEVATPRIILGDREFVAASFQATPWSQASDIIVNGEPLGRLQVCYLRERPERDEGPFSRGERHLLEAIARQLGRTIERLQAKEALRKQTAQSESLRKISLKLNAQLDLHDLLQAITQNAVQLLEGTAGSLYLHRPDLDLLEWVVAVGPHASPLGTMVRHGEGLSGQVWQTDRPLIVDDYVQWAGSLLLSDVFAWGSAVGVPIQYGQEAHEGEFLGVLEVMVNVPRGFSSEDAELLCLFASQAAAAIRNARLYELAQREIARREQAQEELRRERDLVSSIMETSPIGMIILDRQGQIVYANPQVAKIAGVDLESLVLRNYDDPSWRIVGEDGQPLPPEQGPFPRALHSGEPILGEHLTVEAEGGRRWDLSASVIPLIDESGEIGRLVATVEDITARLEADKALRDSEARYRKLVETSPDAITLVDLKGNILACNEQAAALHGFEGRKAMIGFNFLELFPPDDLQRSREDMQKALLEGRVRTLECVLVREDGSRFPAELSISALFDEGGRPQGFVNVTRDITQRVQSQTALRLSEERLRSTMSSLEDLVFVLDRHSRFIDYYQPTTVAELYVSPETFMRRTVREVMPPEVAEPFQEAFDAVAATRQVQQFDYPLGLASEQHWFSAKVSVRLDGQGEFDGVTVVSRDITERKRTEERIQTSLQEKEVLLKEIHHRVKNNLQIISSLLDMQSLSIQSPEAIEALEDSRHRVRTMAFVHERLYQAEDLASVDVREYLESLTGYLLAAYEGNTDTTLLDLQVDDVYLDLDSAIASGLIVNELVSNALKHAFPPGWEGEGKIVVKLGESECDRFQLVVTDNGVGFPSDLDLERAESLGLRLVKMLVQQIEGTLELGRDAGTSFRITFPAAAQTSSQETGHG
jgi:PAS domain S-box-containing protein